MSTDTRTATYTFDNAVDEVRAGACTPDQAADRILDQLTTDELLWLLDGDIAGADSRRLPELIATAPVRAGEIARLGIPGIRFVDGPRGVVAGESTSFPVTMARAATWDADLERRVGVAMGLEGRAKGANYSGAVCVNLLRHPGWGRAQECYGEDPVLTGAMGVALTRGLQENVMACVKHFALNSIENSRFFVDVEVDEHALHEVYLPHFKTIVDAGVDSVMSSYNKVNGEWAGDSHTLLTDILRDEWGFQGLVSSDWVWGIHDPVASVKAGLDIEMPLRLQRARTLPKALKNGELGLDEVRACGRRIIATQLRYLLRRSEVEPSPDVIASAGHRELAYEVATRSAVLLKNDPVDGAPLLPLAPAGVARLAVIGRLAREENLGDKGSSIVRPPTVSTILDGLTAAYSGAAVEYADGSDLAAAATAAKAADAAVLVVGLSFDDEGERVENDNEDGLAVFGFPMTLKFVRRLVMRFAAKSGGAMGQFGLGGDRTRLALHAPDIDLVNAVAAANPRTIVILVGGSALTMEEWRANVPAILMAWYPGMEGGRALADVLTGTAEPGGRLPFAIPADPADLPGFDPTGTTVVYDSSWGQRRLDQHGRPAAYRFGHGLGYTTFEVALKAHEPGSPTVRVSATNTGSRTGSTVVQLYAVRTGNERAVPQLVGFHRVTARAGETVAAEVELDVTPTRERNPETRQWEERPGQWALVADTCSPSALPANALPL